jgi:hypothetical protein
MASQKVRPTSLRWFFGKHLKIGSCLKKKVGAGWGQESMHKEKGASRFWLTPLIFLAPRDRPKRELGGGAVHGTSLKARLTSAP